VFNIWGTLQWLGFNMDMVLQSTWTSFAQRKIDKGSCVFAPQSFLCTIECHPTNYIINDLGRSWRTTLKKCVAAVFFSRG
jgi:hypothetical protein